MDNCDILTGTAIQRAVKRMEKWASRNLMKFNRGKCKILQGEHKPIQWCKLETDQLGCSFTEKNLKVLRDDEVNISQ